MKHPFRVTQSKGKLRRASLGAWLLLTAWVVPGWADANRLVRFYVADKPDHAKLVLEFSAPPDYRLVHWAEPSRLRLDFADTQPSFQVRQPPASHPFVGRIDTTEPPGGGLRLSVALKGNPRHRASVSLIGDRHRLTIELFRAAPVGPTPEPSRDPPPAKPAPLRPTIPAKRPGLRVVVIDAGHGGKDTGAIGPGGHFEKDIVLSIARRLADFIRAEPGLKPALVRRDDRFVPLRTRMALARAAHADLLVSLHADADASGQVRGMSVYTLSERGARHEAGRWLVHRGNGMALAGSLDLRNKQDAVARVLLDLCQRATLADSERAAAAILREARKRFPIHHHQVQKAGFVVLKSPDIPSVLVETGFISHPTGEKDLSNPARQDQIARALFYGIRHYFATASRDRPVGRLADATP